MPLVLDKAPLKWIVWFTHIVASAIHNIFHTRYQNSPSPVLRNILSLLNDILDVHFVAIRIAF